MARQAQIVSFDEARGRSRKGAATRQARAEAARTSRSRLTFLETELDQDDLDEIDSSSISETSRERKRRERVKARADKMFSKQFSETASADVQPEGTPRPAFYETKMGSSHRKAARMQRSSGAVESASAKIDPAGWLSSLNATPRMLKVGTATLCVLLVCVFLYTPAQQYYQAQREHDRLSAEYSVIEERNEALDVQNDILASDAGMEDAVREKYGYVKEGEQTAIVTGLSDSATDTSRDSDGIEANVLSSSVKAPEEWYTPLLDAFFGVE